MTDIIRMAEEAGFDARKTVVLAWDDQRNITEELVRFAALVAEHVQQANTSTEHVQNPAQNERVPLTESQIWAAVDRGERRFVAEGPGSSWTECIVREIERAHGIGDAAVA